MSVSPTEPTIQAQPAAGRLQSDLSAAVAALMVALGDRLGLWRALHAGGPATSDELAARTGLNERYLREWLSAVVCAGYVAYEPSARCYSLGPDFGAVLADEASPAFALGWFAELPPLAGAMGRVANAFRRGGGVPMAEYDACLWEAMDRRARWPQDVAAWPGLAARLERGAFVAEVGCGGGRLLVRLAQAFPNSRFAGFDAFRPFIARASQAAQAARVTDRVSFEHRDVAERGLPERCDVVLLVDVLGEAADPAGLLRAARQGLKARGVCLVGDRLALPDVAGTLVYGLSVLYRLPVSLAYGGSGLGAAGFTEAAVRDLASQAGFAAVRRLPGGDEMTATFELRR